jgi:rubrerythrin
MELQAHQKKIIELFLEQELLMAELYLLFSKWYPFHHEFWESMVAEEREHASWVRHFLDSTLNGKISFNEGKTRSNAISSSISYIRGIIAGFEKKPLNVVRAASISLDMERSLIERNVFKHFEGDSQEAVQLLDILSEAQDAHVKKTEQFAAGIQEKVKN